MRGFSRIALAAVFCLGMAAAAFGADAKAPAAAMKPVTMTPDQLTWVAGVGAPDVKTAVVWGDINKGAHGAFHKFPAGFTAPLHTHSSDLRAVVLSGTMALAGEDGVEMRLPPGSYFFEPHTYKHVTKCLAGSECVAYVTASGKFDLKPVQGKKEPPK